MTSLVAENCSYAYDQQRTAVSAVDLQVAPGELLVLLGSNGAGKSTLLKLLSGQLLPTQGCVKLDDKAIKDYSRREIAKRIALVSQFETTESDLSVREVVSLGRAAHRGWLLPFVEQDQQAIQSALEAMCMVELADRPACTLSGGQWRRMVLARAIAQAASILLLDEPTTGLDLKHQVEAMELLRHLCRTQRASIVVSMHDVNLASLYADRAVLICAGQILAVGSSEQVITSENLEAAMGVKTQAMRHPQRGVPVIVPNQIST